MNMLDRANAGGAAPQAQQQPSAATQATAPAGNFADEVDDLPF
jgi:hypothetical protein